MLNAQKESSKKADTTQFWASRLPSSDEIRRQHIYTHTQMYMQIRTLVYIYIYNSEYKVILKTPIAVYQIQRLETS